MLLIFYICRLRSNSVAKWYCFQWCPFVCVCLSTRSITLEPRDISMKFLSEQDMAKSSEELENGCIPMRYAGGDLTSLVCQVHAMQNMPVNCERCI